MSTRTLHCRLAALEERCASPEPPPRFLHDWVMDGGCVCVITDSDTGRVLTDPEAAARCVPYKAAPDQLGRTRLRPDEIAAFRPECEESAARTGETRRERADSAHEERAK